MESNSYKNNEDKLNVVQDDGGDIWQVAETKNIQRHLKRTHEERFRIMMRLMRIGKMLSNAKVTHQKI